MLRNRITSIFTVGAAAAIMLTSCGSGSSSSVDSSASFSRDIFAMDTFMTIKAYGDSAETALDAAVERVYGLEETLSVTNEKSDIWRIDHAAGNETDVSGDTVTILEKAAEIASETDNALNICLYPVLKAWGFTTSDYRVPTDRELTELLKNTDCNNVKLSGSSVSIPEDYQIDLGALAKGYTSDEIMNVMRDNGATSAIVSLGGNVQSLGLKPDGSEWKVSVRDPFAPDTDMCIIEIGEKAVITSGNYERYFTGDDGKNYWHIIDGNDGYPADNGVVSVTIIGSSGLECDALSTALFVKGYPAACDFWRTRGGFEMILVTDDGKIYYTEGLKDSFQNVSKMPAEVITLA